MLKNAIQSSVLQDALVAKTTKQFQIELKDVERQLDEIEAPLRFLEAEIAQIRATIARGKVLTLADHQRQISAVGSGFGAHMARCVGRDMVLPSNVLHLAVQTSNVGHSAAFPSALPKFFINLFTKTDDVVLDPFCGSGTTCQVAERAGRHFLGFEIDAKYHAVADARLAKPLCDDVISFAMPP